MALMKKRFLFRLNKDLLIFGKVRFTRWKASCLIKNIIRGKTEVWLLAIHHPISILSEVEGRQSKRHRL